MSNSWKLTLPCTKVEAEALQGEILELSALDTPPVIMTNEARPDTPENWILDAYFETRPGDLTIKLIQSLVPSADGITPVLEQLEDQDWVTMSQAGLEPVSAGRFFVHTSAFDGDIPASSKAFLIEAGLAFGTGQHETTTGCLMMLDKLHKDGSTYRNTLDMGTGTGLLAFAAMDLWPDAVATASDIDPISIDVTAENAAKNAVALGNQPGRLALIVAPGMEHADLLARAPYDLIIANILAGPLIELAPAIAAGLAPSGTIILAGLLDSQAERVAEAYAEQGINLADRIDPNEWPTLMLRKK